MCVYCNYTPLIENSQMAIKLFEPQSDEWLSARQNYVTGTEAAALLGLDKYKTWRKLKSSKLKHSSVADNQYMRAGRLLEPGVILALNEMGIPAEAAHPNKVVFAYNDEYRLSASMDGKAVTEDGFYIVECKTTQPTKFDAWEDEVPINYFIQVQTQLLLANTKSAVLACLSVEFPFPLVVWEITADPNIQEFLIDASKRFWDIVNTEDKFVVNEEHKKYVVDNYHKFCEYVGRQY